MSALRMVAATVVSVFVLASTACGSMATGRSALAPVRSSATATVSACEATVLALLGESAADLEDGDAGGLDTVSVMEKYGAESPVYRAFIALDGDVLTAEEQNGNTRLLTSFVSQVRQRCAQYQERP